MEATLPFSFLPPFSIEGQLLKERIGSSKQVLSLKSRPHLDKAVPSNETNSKSQKLFPFVPYFFGYKTDYFPSKTIPKI